MQLIKLNEDKETLVGDILPLFKEHIRVLHNLEDDLIMMYLGAAIDGIAQYSGNDIFLSEYEVFYPTGKVDYSVPSTLLGWYCGKIMISDVIIQNNGGVDITSDFTVDKENGMIYPHPNGNVIHFKVGFRTGDDIPRHLLSIILRYGASLYEEREHIRVGDPKLLPDWITHALASVWKPRV